VVGNVEKERGEENGGYLIPKNICVEFRLLGYFFGRR
jgi:hypothetical protein